MVLGAGLFDAIRTHFWPIEAERRAKNAMKQTNYRAKEGKMSEDQRKELLEMDFADKLANQDPSWYPEWWLVFVLFGKPAGAMCRASIGGSEVLKRNDRGMFAPADGEAVEGALSKFKTYVSRRQKQAMVAAGMVPGIDDPCGGGGAQRIKHGTKRTSSSIDLTDDDSSTGTSIACVAAAALMLLLLLRAVAASCCCCYYYYFCC